MYTSFRILTTAACLLFAIIGFLFCLGLLGRGLNNLTGSTDPPPCAVECSAGVVVLEADKDLICRSALGNFLVCEED